MSYNDCNMESQNAMTGTGPFGTGKESRWLVESGAEEVGLITLEQAAEQISVGWPGLLPVTGDCVV